MNTNSNSKSNIHHILNCIHSIWNSCIKVAQDARATEHAHAKSNVMNCSEPKCDKIGNPTTVRRRSFIVILNIGEIRVDPYTADYEPNNKKQINKEKKNIKESYCIRIFF